MLKKALVIGASHFLGYHTALRLSKLGFRVTGLIHTEDFLWRYPENFMRVDIAKINIFSSEAVLQFIREHKFDYFVYVANYGEKFFQRDSSTIFYLNLFLLKEVVGLISEIGFESFIHIGSFVDQVDNQPKNKNAFFLSETDFYFRELKKLATLFLEKEAVEKSLPLYTVKPFLIYGSHFSPYSMMGRLLLNIVLKKRIMPGFDFCHGDFLHIKDFVNFVVSVLLTRPDKDFTFDCGSGTSLDYSLFLQKLRSVATGVSFKNCVMSSELSHDEVCAAANMFSHDKYFPWQPSIKIEDGLRELFKWVILNQRIYANSTYVETLPCQKTLIHAV